VLLVVRLDTDLSTSFLFSTILAESRVLSDSSTDLSEWLNLEAGQNSTRMGMNLVDRKTVYNTILRVVLLISA